MQKDEAMRRFLLRTLCTAILGAAGAHADEFSWQLGAAAQDADIARNVDGEAATLSVTYYFRPVDDRSGPYALAPFLERSSRIGATYSENKTTSLVPVVSIGPFSVPVPAQPPRKLVSRAAGRSLSGRSVWRESGWYVGAAFAETDAAHPAPLPAQFSVLGDDLTTRSLTLGKYVARTTAVELVATRDAGSAAVAPFSDFAAGGADIRGGPDPGSTVRVGAGGALRACRRAVPDAGARRSRLPIATVSDVEAVTLQLIGRL